MENKATSPTTVLLAVFRSGRLMLVRSSMDEPFGLVKVTLREVDPLRIELALRSELDPVNVLGDASEIKNEEIKEIGFPPDSVIWQCNVGPETRKPGLGLSFFLGHKTSLPNDVTSDVRMLLELPSVRAKLAD